MTELLEMIRKPPPSLPVFSLTLVRPLKFSTLSDMQKALAEFKIATTSLMVTFVVS